MRGLIIWLALFTTTVVIVVVSFLWFDRPIALFVHDHFRGPQRDILDELSHISNPLIVLAVVVFMLLGLRALISRPLPNYQTAAFVSSLSIIFAEATKDQLKYVFSRTWPETWVQNNPSFIRDGVFGFNWFHGGSAYQSFPSGHMATTCALISVVWIWYPRLRMLWASAGFAVAVGLVGANYHFLSDVIAGAFLGTSTGWMAIRIWKISSRATVRQTK